MSSTKTYSGRGVKSGKYHKRNPRKGLGVAALVLTGESMQNRQNEEEPIDVNYSVSKVKDKLSVTWEIKPVEPRPNLYGKPVVIHIPMRMVFVIDVSHSMAEPYGPDPNVSKLDKIKVFAQLLVNQFVEDDSLSIITFGTSAKVVFPLRKMHADEKERAISAIEKIEVGGVTHLSAGIFAGIEQFKDTFAKSRFFNDNLMVFTDGMANEGITETEEIITEIKKKIDVLKEECHYEEDYTVKIITMGTTGFLPELIFDIGRAFSSDAFYLLEDDAVMELNLMKPVLLRETAMVTNMYVRLTGLNGVTLKREEMSNEYRFDRALHVDENADLREDVADFFIHDLSMDMEKHIICVLNLPNKHKKHLKKKDVLKMEVQYRDPTMVIRSYEKIVPYSDLPIKKSEKSSCTDIILITQHEARFFTQQVFDDAADCMKRLDRSGAKNIMQNGIGHLRSLCDNLSATGDCTEEALECLMQYLEPLIANMEVFERTIGDYSFRWDDAWAKLKAISSSLVREAPTAIGIFVDGTDMFTTTRINDRIDSLCAKLREMYIARGMCTAILDQYRLVMKELKDRLMQLEISDEQENGQAQGTANCHATFHGSKETRL